MEGPQGVQINNNRITATGDIEILSKNGVFATFTPVAVIEHRGRVNSQGVTSGHYTADVKSRNGLWFHTDDQHMPRKIDRRKVTKNAAVVLYCKKKLSPNN